jgi:hypothetical protein
LRIDFPSQCCEVVVFASVTLGFVSFLIVAGARLIELVVAGPLSEIIFVNDVFLVG